MSDPWPTEGHRRSSRRQDADRKRRTRDQRVPKMNQYLLWIAFLMIFFLGIPYREALGGSWDQLSQQEQQILKPFKDRWDQLPAERQERLRRGAERWQRMTPEERQEAQERYKRWQELPPEQKEMIRKRYQEFRALPPEEQEKVRNRSKWFRDLPPDVRQQLREKWQHEEHREFRPKWPREMEKK